MKSLSLLCALFLLTACAEPKIEARRVENVDGNRLQITSGTTANKARFLTIEKVDKKWGGPLAGGQKKWNARATLLNSWATQEIRTICGEWVYRIVREPVYRMLDSDETMGGVAPVLGVAASMAAYLAADSATDPANVPVSLYTEFSCRYDES